MGGILKTEKGTIIYSGGSPPIPNGFVAGPPTFG